MKFIIGDILVTRISIVVSGQTITEFEVIDVLDEYKMTGTNDMPPLRKFLTTTPTNFVCSSMEDYCGKMYVLRSTTCDITGAFSIKYAEAVFVPRNSPEGTFMRI